MRKIGIPVAMVVASLGVAGIAQAVDVNQGLTVKTVGKKGTKSKPTGLKLTTITSTTAKDGTSDGTYGTRSAVIHFDKNMRFSPKSFPGCDVNTVLTDAASCPKGSLVGKGTTIATVGPDKISQHPAIAAYNAKDGKLLLKLIPGQGDIDTKSVLVGTLKSDRGKYGQKLVVPIPEKLQNNLGLFITLNKFSVVIGKQKSKGKYYVSSIGCTGGKYHFGGDFVYTDGSSAKVTTTAKC